VGAVARGSYPPVRARTRARRRVAHPVQRALHLVARAASVLAARAVIRCLAFARARDAPTVGRAMGWARVALAVIAFEARVAQAATEARKEHAVPRAIARVAAVCSTDDESAVVASETLRARALPREAEPAATAVAVVWQRLAVDVGSQARRARIDVAALAAPPPIALAVGKWRRRLALTVARAALPLAPDPGQKCASPGHRCAAVWGGQHCEDTEG